MSILVLTSDTLIGTAATGNIEYNGQFFGTDSAASRAQMQRITQGTAVASTSGTAIDFTSLPAWVKKITVMLSGVSTSGTSNILVQFGAGAVDTSGYVGTGTRLSGGVSTSVSFTAGVGIPSDTAAATNTGVFVLTTLGSNTWSVAAMVGGSNTATYVSGGGKTLSGTLDRIRLTTVNGTDTFDAGSVNILYEG